VWSLWETAFWAVFHRIHALFALAAFEVSRTDLTERGRFLARFFVGGELKQVRFFTKDASEYFLQF